MPLYRDLGQARWQSTFRRSPQPSRGSVVPIDAIGGRAGTAQSLPGQFGARPAFPDATTRSGGMPGSKSASVPASPLPRTGSIVKQFRYVQDIVGLYHQTARSTLS